MLLVLGLLMQYLEDPNLDRDSSMPHALQIYFHRRLSAFRSASRDFSLSLFLFKIVLFSGTVDFFLGIITVGFSSIILIFIMV